MFPEFSAELNLPEDIDRRTFIIRNAVIWTAAAMLPYTVIKEANPPEFGGTARGVINFINFTFSALLGPLFGARLVEMPEGDTTLALAHYQAGFKPLLY